MSRPFRPFGAALLTAAILAACEPSADDYGGDPIPTMAFDSAAVRIATAGDTVDLRVEVAANRDQRAMGLMERASLDPDAGMIFIYPDDQPGDAAFWMFRTRIPLDIAFLDAGGRILAIRAMDPCPSPEPRWCVNSEYAPGVPYRAALEVNRGFFDRHGITPGDSVLLPDLPAASLWRAPPLAILRAGSPRAPRSPVDARFLPTLPLDTELHT